MDGELPILRIRAIDLGVGWDPLEGDRKQADLGPVSQLPQAWFVHDLTSRPERAADRIDDIRYGHSAPGGCRPGGRIGYYRLLTRDRRGGGSCRHPGFD